MIYNTFVFFYDRSYNCHFSRAEKNKIEKLLRTLVNFQIFLEQLKDFRSFVKLSKPFKASEEFSESKNILGLLAFFKDLHQNSKLFWYFWQTFDAFLSLPKVFKAFSRTLQSLYVHQRFLVLKVNLIWVSIKESWT